MALTYDKVINVISQKPDLRKDFEVNNLLPWFRKKSQLFATLKTELLFDIIKNLQFVKMVRDDICIRQGDQGDCMYILLRGQVTIFILYAPKGDAEEDKPNQPVVTAKAGEDIRKQLGTFVTNLGPGATFGEVALMNDDCPRTASIIVNEPTDFIVIDRELYNRSVKNVLKQEFEDKANFIANNRHFQGWPPKYKKQLTMALQKESVPYDGVLAKQGDPLEAIYFILNGEIKLVVDPLLHKSQYTKLLEAEEQTLSEEKPRATDSDDTEDDLLKSVSGTRERSNNELGLQPKFRKKPVKRQPQEVCLLATNESIGDMEVLMDLDTYSQSATCTQKTDVLVLEMKHYERLLVKRNPRSIEAMKEGLEVKLKSRFNTQMTRTIPLFRCLLNKACEYNLQRKQQIEARHNAHQQEKHSKHVKTIGETFDSFVPPQGALIDIYGPGTVFHRIREREAAKAKKLERLGQHKNVYSGFHGISAAGLTNGSGTSRQNEAPTDSDTHYQAVDRLTSDPVLSDLEKRMREWLAQEYGSQSNAPGALPTTSSSSRSQPRVAKLHRAPHAAEADKIRPGARVVLRPRDHHSTGSIGSNGVTDDVEDESLVHHGHAWVKGSRPAPRHAQSS